jgi:hypothetical protein
LNFDPVGENTEFFVRADLPFAAFFHAGMAAEPLLETN